MNFTSVKNNKKTINLKNKNKNYEVNAQWLYEHSTNSKIRDNYTNQLLIEAAEIDEHLYVKSAKIKKNILTSKKELDEEIYVKIRSTGKLIKSKLEPFLEKQGYVSKEKYEGVLKILESLEKRLEKLESRSEK